MEFADEYTNIMRRMLHPGLPTVYNQRTNTGCIEGFGMTLMIDVSQSFLPMINLRKTWPHLAWAETLWFLLGSKDASFINERSSFWKPFTSEKGEVEAAYGHRERFAGPVGEIDQIAKALKLLKADPTSRRVYIDRWRPELDLVAKSANAPCPVGYTLNIINGRLYSLYTLRSSDVFVGLPYDILAHAFLMQVLAKRLNVGLGHILVTAANTHLYERYKDAAYDLVNAPFVPIPKIPMLPERIISPVADDLFILAQGDKETRREIAEHAYAEGVEFLADYKSELEGVPSYKPEIVL